MTIIHKIIQAILILCFALVPTVFWMNHFQSFVTIKNFIFVVSVLICCGLLMITYLSGARPAFRPNRLTSAVSAYYLYNLASLLLYPYTDRTAFFFFTCLVLLFFVVSAVMNETGKARLLHTLFGVALLSSIYGGFQFFGVTFFRGFHLYFGEMTIGKLTGMRIFATFGHPNLLGGFCVVILPLLTVSLIHTIQAKRYGLSAYVGLITLLTLLSLLLSKTRGSWLAVMIEAGLLLLILFRTRLIVLLTRYSLLLTGVLLVATVMVVGLIPALRHSTSLMDSTSLSIRRLYYKDTLTMITERPLLGRGFGTFNVYYPLYRDERSASETGESVENYRVEHPHNEHLEILSDTGLIGYGLFLWIVIEALLRLLRKKTLPDAAIAVSLIGLLCDGLLSQNLRFIVIASLFWLLLGFANMRDTQTISPVKKATEDRTTQRSPRRNAILVGVGLCILLYGLFFAYNIMQADSYVKGGMSFYLQNQPQRAAAIFQKALVNDPRNKRALYYAASAFKLIKQPEQAKAYYRTLLDRDPNFLQANFHLGSLYAVADDLDTAHTYFERQIAADSLHWKACYNLALLEWQQQHPARAKQYLEEIERINKYQAVDPEILTRLRTILSP